MAFERYRADRMRGGIIARAMNAPRPRVVAARCADAGLLLVCVLAACALALSLRQDANWDLQNYHFYDPWAWLAGRVFDHDLAAAQLQTFHNPLADVPFYLLAADGVDPRLVTLWLALPMGIAAWLSCRIAWRLLADLTLPQRAGATIAALAIGFGGAMGIAQAGTTTGEWLVTALIMAALLLALQRYHARDGTPGARALLLAGAIAGIASGLKLTAATYALGLFVALCAEREPLNTRVRGAALYACGVLVGIAIALGPWCVQLWRHFGNPLFPYGNEWIRSPWWDARPVLPRIYGPHTVSDWLWLPFKLLAPPTGFVSELPYVDARFPLTYLLALIAAGGVAAAWLRRCANPLPPQFATTSSQWRFVSAFFAASFIAWAIVHSILRYTIPLEIASGLLIVGLIGYLLPPRHATVAIVLAVAGLAATTSRTDWGRVDFGPRWFDVRVPPVEPGALVLLVASTPMSYVLPFFPPDAQFVGIRSNLVDPAQHNRLAKSIAARVRDHRGPLYALSFPAGDGESDLRAHALERVPGGCADVRTNMPTSPIELCRLQRVGAMR
jgi:hypothetical protein